MNPSNPGGHSWLGSSKKLLIIGVTILLVVLAVGLYNRHHSGKFKNVSPDQATIDYYKKSANTEDQKNLIGAYIDTKDYDKAKSVAQKIADKTKAPEDYLAVLNVCGLYNVSDKSGCINTAVAALKPKINQLQFSSAYSAGTILEKIGYKKDAAVFYERALTVYNANAQGDNPISQDTLKNHINELNK